MRPAIALVAIASALALPLGSEAAACTWAPPVEVGGASRSAAQLERERQTRERRQERRLLRTRQAAAEAAAAAGYDMTGALAEILVPNVRPVHIERDSCGIPNEDDHGEGEETLADLLAGTPFADWGDGIYNFVPRPWRGETIGPACNAELRGRFAALLRRELTEDQLRDAYLFLASRVSGWKGDPQPLRNVTHPYDGTPVRRLVAFEGSSRQLPIRWTTRSPGDAMAIQRWIERSASGRALKAAMDRFWLENGPLLASPEAACPAATARWPSVQAQLLVPAAEWRRRHPNRTPPR